MLEKPESTPSIRDEYTLRLFTGTNTCEPQSQSSSPLLRLKIVVRSGGFLANCSIKARRLTTPNPSSVAPMEISLTVR
jgi:hypothetical protein